jgi:hypothetical protein
MNIISTTCPLSLSGLNTSLLETYILDQQYVLLLSHDFQYRLYSMDSKALISSGAFPEENTTGLGIPRYTRFFDWLADGRVLYTSLADNSIKLFDLRTGLTIKQWKIARELRFDLFNYNFVRKAWGSDEIIACYMYEVGILTLLKFDANGKETIIGTVNERTPNFIAQYQNVTVFGSQSLNSDTFRIRTLYKDNVCTLAFPIQESSIIVKVGLLKENSFFACYNNYTTLVSGVMIIDLDLAALEKRSSITVEAGWEGFRDFPINNEGTPGSSILTGEHAFYPQSGTLFLSCYNGIKFVTLAEKDGKLVANHSEEVRFDSKDTARTYGSLSLDCIGRLQIDYKTQQASITTFKTCDMKVVYLWLLNVTGLNKGMSLAAQVDLIDTLV